MYICIGKIVNTHGIKGEIRIISHFDLKEKVFIKDMPIFIGKNKERQVINTYRQHKNFDMITLNGFGNINEVLKYKGALVYVLREDLKFGDDEYLDSDLIDLPIYRDDILISKVKRIDRITDKNKVLVFDYNLREVLVPFVSEFVKVDFKNKKVDVSLIEGMI